MLLSLFLLTLQTTTPQSYADSATRALVEHAKERHDYQDRLVRDYTAMVRTRIDVSYGRSRFARAFPFIAHETAARLTWALPNDMKVDILGKRDASVFAGGSIDAEFDRPWFIPRSLGDSIRVVDDEMPATAALHPLAYGAERHYRYAIIDSLMMELPGRTVRAINVRVEPHQMAKSLVAGDMWLDAETVEVVRFSFVFLGEYLWETPDHDATPEDSARIREGNKWGNRILKIEADLEYALLDADYWMPNRQLVRLSVEFPWFTSATLQVRFLTTFDDYEINQGTLPVFAAPPAPPEEPDEDTASADTTAADSTGGASVRMRRERTFRCGDGERRCNRDETGFFRVGEAERDGRFEVYYPPADSLEYAWPDELALGISAEDEQRIHETVATLGRLAEDLPDQWVGRTRHGVAFERFSDIYRFNRVQGSSVGAGYEVYTGFDFTTLVGTARFGLGDRRVTGSLTWRRDAPSGRLDVSAYREIHEAEAWTRGQTFPNSVNALFTAHDDADYFMASGGRVRFQSNGRGFWRDFDVSVGYERHRSLTAFMKSDVASFFGARRFFPNAAVAESDFAVGAVARRSRLGTATFDQGVRAYFETSANGPRRRAVRAFGTAAVPFEFFDRNHRLAVRGAITTGDQLPQLLNRVGGPETVRGFPYAYRWGTRSWSAQLDVALRRTDAYTPVIFVDVGDAYGQPTRLAPAGTGDTGEATMVGVGVGWSLARGLIRANFSYGVRPDWGLRFDIRLAAPR